MMGNAIKYTVQCAPRLVVLLTMLNFLLGGRLLFPAQIVFSLAYNLMRASPQGKLKFLVLIHVISGER